MNQPVEFFSRFLLYIVFTIFRDTWVNRFALGDVVASLDKNRAPGALKFLSTCLPLLIILWAGQAEAAKAPNWKALVLIYPKTDVTYIDKNGVSRHVISEMTPEQVNHAAYQARQFYEYDVPALNSGSMYPEVTISIPDRVLTDLGGRYGGGFALGPEIAAPDVDPSYDSVFVIWQPSGIDQNTGESIYLGGAGGLAYGRGTGQTYAWGYFGGLSRSRNILKHEWGHSILFYFAAAGATPLPSVSNHATVDDYVNCLTGDSYVWTDETDAFPIPNSIYNNETGFTHDYYSGTVATADQPMRCLGITPEAWAVGGPATKPVEPPFLVSTESLLVSSSTGILRYDRFTGNFIDVFVPLGSGGLANAQGLSFGPDGNLYVASFESREILRYNGKTGGFIDVFITAGSGGMGAPNDVTFGPDGNLYVADGFYGTSSILRYNGKTGSFIDVFATGGGMQQPGRLIFGPDKNLFVGNATSSDILRYHGDTGLPHPSSGNSGAIFVPGIQGPFNTALAIGPGGDLFIRSGASPDLKRYSGKTGDFINTFGLATDTTDLVFGPDRNLYISKYFGSSVLRHNGSSGTFMDTFVPANSGGLSRAKVLTFGISKEQCGNGGWINFGFESQGQCVQFANSRQIDVSSDDAEQRPTGTLTLTSHDLEMVDTNKGTQTIGLRFHDLAIPAGSTIARAYVQFHAEESHSGQTNLVVRAEMIDDALTFTSSRDNITGRNTTSAQVDWDVPAWTSGDSNQSQRTPDLSSVLQEVVSMPGWKDGNAIALIIRGTGLRSAHSYDSDPTMAPKLMYSLRETLDLAITEGKDDAEQRSNGSVTLTSNDLEMVEGGSGTQTVGLRYTDIAIPAGATVNHAYLQFTAEEARSGATDLVIRAEDSGDAKMFVKQKNNLSNRDLTTEKTDWAVPAWVAGESGPAQLSPDLSAVIQEVIDRGDWASGNALALIVTGSGKREADSFEASPATAPVLHIAFTP